jgi:hypothetical protein
MPFHRHVSPRTDVRVFYKKIRLGRTKRQDYWPSPLFFVCGIRNRRPDDDAPDNELLAGGRGEGERLGGAGIVFRSTVEKCFRL